MYKHILLPIDLTDRHQAALRAATDLAKSAAGSATLLHVIQVIPGLEIDEEKAFYDRLRRDAEAHLDRLGQALSKAGVSWQRAVVMGQRVRATLEEARNRGADLIVLTGVRPDPAQFLAGLGSLSMKIALLAETPVLLVKP